ncbi:hypothetical protein Golob_001072 [Gossypium lobatum]|uniref:Uncharacterized protein n=1 Tax=Gossypium lobatum TaxID=34289 RepID=A0A7J8NA71_9ROSI|nr:hypothetical protein [Gossypium lobatum]
MFCFDLNKLDSKNGVIKAYTYQSLIECCNIDQVKGPSVNEGMSQKAVHKALYEAAALIGASVLQVFLLRRLFDWKLVMPLV